jgi:hypothetical protein
MTIHPNHGYWEHERRERERTLRRSAESARRLRVRRPKGAPPCSPETSA